jgi:hypothetical protein
LEGSSTVTVMKTFGRLPLTATVAVAIVALAPAAVAVQAGAGTAVDTTRQAPAGGSRLQARQARSPQSAPGLEHDAYGWPVKPFHRQHPVRGFFGDPRISNHGETRQFHFGVDVSAPNGTPVYATLTGTAYVNPMHDTTVTVVGKSGVAFEYWHVTPTIRSGQAAVAYKTVIGRIEKPWAHVHFAEAHDGAYLNPLRPGAMGPFLDTTKPFASRITAESGGRVVSPRPHRPFALVAQMQDETPLAVPRPWHDLPVMPALVRWRLLDAAGRVVLGWHTVIDFRRTIPDASAFDRTWAPGVSQNHVRMPGKYRVYLERSVDGLRAGTYTIEVAARDTRGNASVTRAALAVGNV